MGVAVGRPTSRKDCPFCAIVQGYLDGRSPSVLFQDSHLVAFQDRNPSARRHLLVIPVDHVKNVKTLQRSEADFQLVARMLKLGQSLLLKDASDGTTLRFGFHRPPFNSVDHLHLHCIELPYRSWWRPLKYISLGSWGSFLTAEHVLKKLRPTGGT